MNTAQLWFFFGAPILGLAVGALIFAIGKFSDRAADRERRPRRG